MNISGRHHAALAFVVALSSLLDCLGTSHARESQASQLSPGEEKEYERVQSGLRKHEDLLNAAGWTLVHCAEQGEDTQVEVEKTLTLLQAFVDTNQIPKLVEAGGVKGFKDKVATLLVGKDPVVRGFAAVLLAAAGDTERKRDIASLLGDKRGSAPKEEEKLLYNFDRSRAAMALGLMGAREYEPRLAVLLHSSDPADRAGAALGLGYMGAKAQIKDLAKLLSDDAYQVQIAAVTALANLAALDRAKDIAKLLTFPDPSVNETACYALVRLNAKEQARDLAALLDDRFRKGNAAKALALLGAKEYTDPIARLTEDGGPLVRCDALIALGILGATEHAESIAAHLQDTESFVRAYAAVALLLMGDQKHSQGVREVVLTEMKLPEIVSDGVDARTYFQARIKLHPVIAETRQLLVARTLQEWQRANGSQERLQQDGPAKGSQPMRSEPNSTSPAAGSPR